jgi:hypothetical protein
LSHVWNISIDWVLNLNLLVILDIGCIFKAVTTTLCHYVLVGTGKGQSFCGVKDQAGQRLKLHNNHFLKYTRYSHLVPFFLTVKLCY